ncbi:MAG: tRNA guanosine(15) transglycosylase TgtA, partial [Methanomassiliicoccales archaeon]|nr:tRNA guanosine(15) transglycosylase TgtA [Methanomassiliicoccales archaeon]
SYLHGEVDVDNREMVEFQRSIGSDIGTVLDVFTEPSWGRERASEGVDVTVERTREAVGLKGDMMLGGVVQGSLFPDLRESCARRLSELNVDVHPIGGVVPLMEAYRFADLVDVIVASKKGLTPARPVHLFGAGHPMVFALAVLLGCDMFDSASYAKYARDGRFMFVEGTMHLTDMKRISCNCPACRGRSIESMREMSEEEKARLIARHNLYEMAAEMERVKRAIAEGSIWELAELRCRSHPALLNGLRRMAEHKTFLEKYEPLSRDSPFFYTGKESLDRPSAYRYEKRFFERYEQPQTEILIGFEDGRRPYTSTYSAEMSAVSAKSDAHFLVMSPFGPVPIELDEIYPISQSLFPEIKDVDMELKIRDLMERMSHHQNYGMCVIWDGEETLTMIDSIARGKSKFDIDMARIRAVADYQFGKGAASILFDGEVKLVKSKTTERIRNVLLDGKHILSMRANDGFYTLRPEGAERLRSGFPSPKLRVIVDKDSAEFNREGKNVFCGFVLDCDEEIRPFDEVIVVDESDKMVAIGRAMLTREEMLAFEKGLAVKVREGIVTGSAAGDGERLLRDSDAS